MSPEGGSASGEAPPAHRLRLVHDGAAIDVGSDDASALVWLAEFLGPAFAIGEGAGAAPDHVVRLVQDPEAHARCAGELARAPRRELDVFGLDGSFYRSAAFAGEDGRLWVFEPRQELFFGVSAGARSVRVLGARADADPRVGAMRAVRELAIGAAERRGRLPLHAAAFVVDDGAVLVCGAKRAGKTSLLVHALRCGAGFLSNDRVFAELDAAPRVRGVPTIAMLRDGTLALHPWLREAFERARFDRARTLEECAPGAPRPAPHRRAGFDRPGVSAAQLCRLAGDAPMHAAAPLRGLLFPRIDARARGLRLEALDAAAARAGLETSVFRSSRPRRPSQVFAGPGARCDAGIESAGCERLAREVPAFACVLGPDAYERDLLEALRGELSPAAPSAASRKPSSV